MSTNNGTSSAEPAHTVSSAEPELTAIVADSDEPVEAPGPTPAPIEADDLAALETDSAFGGDTNSEASSTHSLNSNALKYRKENGRTYHGFKDGVYLLPNDEAEQDRLDMQHHTFYLVNDGKLYSAPINNPARVLDVGTGTGIWAIDFADQHPASHVIGCDLSPIQPTYVPPNLEFEVDDISAPWLHKPFNFIHIRQLAGSLLSYKDMLASAFENLVPGGWCETFEYECWIRDQRDDPTGAQIGTPMVGAPMLQQWQTGVQEAGIKIGRRFDCAWSLKQWFEEIGFVNVVLRRVKTPCAPWPRNRKQKELGLYSQQNLLDACSSYGAAPFTRVLGWSIEEFTVLGAGMRNEVMNSDKQLYTQGFNVYGQKPMTAGPATTQT